MSIQRIAVAVDFSESSKGAADHALSTARRVGASLHLLHSGPASTDHHPLHEWAQPETLRLLEAARQASVQQHQKGLERERDRLAATDVEVTCHYTEKVPPEGLESLANELNVDLLFVGAGEKSLVQRVWLGSISHGLLRCARRPIMVARGTAPGQYQRILVGTDFSPGAWEAVRTAAELLEPGARLVVLHAIDIPPAASDDVFESLVPKAKLEGQSLLERVGRRDITLRFEVARGKPHEELLYRQEDFDAIAVGTQGRQSLSDWVLGSTAERVAKACTRSLLCVPTKREGETP